MTVEHAPAPSTGSGVRLARRRTGLGLAIVHRLVTADGGTIELQRPQCRPRRRDHASGRRPEQLSGHDGDTPMNVLRVGLVLVLALVAAIVANLVLLGFATGPNDPVGKLSPRADLIRLPRTPSTAQYAAAVDDDNDHPHDDVPGPDDDDHRARRRRPPRPRHPDDDATARRQRRLRPAARRLTAARAAARRPILAIRGQRLARR